jgi:DNA-binding response OmpR family regulator
MNSRIRPCVLYSPRYEDVCESLSALLGFAGVEANPTGTVAETLRIAQADACDLYLMDSSITDDDIELRRQLRTASCADPFLFFSAITYDSDKRRR